MKKYLFTCRGRIPYFCVALGLQCLIAVTCNGAESLIVSLNTIQDRVRKQNPDLAAARYRIAEAKGRFVQSGRRSNPELGIDTSHNTRSREYGMSVSIAQKFPVTNRLELEKAVSYTSLKAAEAEVLDVERRLVAESKQLLVKVLAIRKQMELLRQQEKVAKELADYIRKAADKGEGSALDAGQAKLEAAQFTNSIRQLNAQAASLNGQLKPLLGMSTDESLVISGSLPTLKLPARSVAPGRRPDLHAAKLHALAASEAAILERAKRLDDIEVSVSAGLDREEDAPNGYENEVIVGIGVRIPLPLWNKNEGAIQEADARKARKQKEVQALAHNIRHQASGAYKEMMEWAKLAREIDNNLLPLAQKQNKLAEQAYREGQSDLQDLLRVRDQQLKLQASLNQANENYQLARIRYFAAINK